MTPREDHEPDPGEPATLAGTAPGTLVFGPPQQGPLHANMALREGIHRAPDGDGPHDRA